MTVRTKTFYTRTKIRKLAVAGNDEHAITVTALDLLDEFELDRPIRLLGVRLELAMPRMLTTVAMRGYRSLRDVVVPLADLTVITGANGTGKSSVYRALRLWPIPVTARSSGRWHAKAGWSRRHGRCPRGSPPRRADPSRAC